MASKKGEMDYRLYTQRRAGISPDNPTSLALAKVSYASLVRPSAL